MDKIEEGLFKAYSAELCRYQVSIHKARQTRMNTDIQRYFNSTTTRNAFARLMSLATYDKTLYTKTNIHTELHITRQAAHVMVEECLDAGWIECRSQSRGSKGYRATERLVLAMEDYVQQHYELISEHYSLEALLALQNYRKLRQAN